jgi:hypothetical protein
MDHLIMLIGDAAVDPNFRDKFFENPIEVAEQYGFRFTKGEFEMM